MKYYVSINDKQYEIEVEKGQAEVLNVTTVQEPVAAQLAQAAVPAPVAMAPSTTAAPTATPGNGEAISAPMPGNILDVKVNAGDTVKTGQLLVVLEAMKMENEILAPRDGTVTQVDVQKGITVDTGAPLLYLQ